MFTETLDRDNRTNTKTLTMLQKRMTTSRVAMNVEWMCVRFRQ